MYYSIVTHHNDPQPPYQLPFEFKHQFPKFTNHTLLAFVFCRGITTMVESVKFLGRNETLISEGGVPLSGGLVD